MSYRRGESSLSFVAGIRKPAGMTSHDVVNVLRRALGERRVGHAGTLDPFATGVMLMLIGPATRLSKYLINHDKRYIARILFGTQTTTDDLEGEVMRTCDVPAEVSDIAYAQTILDTFQGEIMQVPCTYSALKKDGKTAYKQARQGNDLDLQARPVQVYEYKLLEVGIDNNNVVFWDVEFFVSKGTYIRALARDIGIAAHTAAHLGALQRIEVAGISEQMCIDLPDFELNHPAIIDPVALLHYPEISLSYNLQERTLCGNAIDYKNNEHHLHNGENVCLTTPDELLAIYKYHELRGQLVPDCVFSQGVARG
ncbi:MAG: tRNA pseudouridine(55) synthase TruB [Eggerthellaceae bacterium]|nr:tRNA pseudouridine(55) synthase TruB [Eggerthellaceae bacterium]